MILYVQEGVQEGELQYPVVEIVHTDIYMYSRDMNDIKYIPTL